jgi:hypothetical protein
LHKSFRLTAQVLIFELPVTQKIIEKNSPKDLFKAESAPESLEFVELFSRAGKF